MPLYRRLPKRGFTNINTKNIVAIDISKLDKFEDGSEVTVESLMDMGIVRNPGDGVKIIGNSGISKKLTVKVTTSKGARSSIEAAGGTCEVE